MANPQPAKPDTPATLRQNRETILENIRAAEAMIRYRQDTLTSADSLLADAEEAVQTATEHLEQLRSRIQDGPDEIEKLQTAIKRMKREIHKIDVAPRLAKLRKLQEEIAKLEHAGSDGGCGSIV